MPRRYCPENDDAFNLEDFRQDEEPDSSEDEAIPSEASQRKRTGRAVLRKTMSLEHILHAADPLAVQMLSDPRARHALKPRSDTLEPHVTFKDIMMNISTDSAEGKEALAQRLGQLNFPDSLEEGVGACNGREKSAFRSCRMPGEGCLN